jgi:hypothetical protein
LPKVTPIPTSSTLAAYQKSPEKAAQDAEQYANHVFALSQRLIPMTQAVFRAWLKSQSRGSVQQAEQDEIQSWLLSLHPGLAQSEYVLLVAEIAWLETLAEYFCST